MDENARIACDRHALMLVRSQRQCCRQAEGHNDFLVALEYDWTDLKGKYSCAVTTLGGTNPFDGTRRSPQIFAEQYMVHSKLERLLRPRVGRGATIRGEGMIKANSTTESSHSQRQYIVQLSEDGLEA